MVSELAEPVAAPSFEDVDDELDHIVCCDDDVTLCGKYLPGDDFFDVGVDDPDLCEVCANKERLGLPCPIAGCADEAGS